jgi:hypothetical protein
MFLVGKKQHFEVIPLFVNNSTLTAKNRVLWRAQLPIRNILSEE